VFALGFKHLGEHSSRFTYLGDAQLGDAMRRISTEEPDVVVLDHQLGTDVAARLCRTISDAQPGLPVLVVSATRDPEAVSAVIAAGARGYVLGDVREENLRQAVTLLATGNGVLDPRVTRVILEAHHAGLMPSPVQPIDVLTDRELQILKMVSEGVPNKAIATTLGVSINTVKTHLRRTIGKLGCHSRSEAVAEAVRRQLI
jgi:DNA-binding NarL/FixJ family response regulator